MLLGIKYCSIVTDECLSCCLLEEHDPYTDPCANGISALKEFSECALAVGCVRH